MARSLPAENLQPQNVGSIINYLQQCTEEAQWELLVAVYHNQLRTMASETVDLIDWSHRPHAWAVPPELHVLHGVNAAYKSQDLLHQPGLKHASTGMPDQRTTCEATQGIYDNSTYMTTPRMDIRYTYRSYTYGYSKDICTFYLHMVYLLLLLG